MAAQSAPLGELSLLTITEASRLLRLDRTTVRRMVEAGDLPTVQVRADRRIPYTALVEFLERAS